MGKNQAYLSLGNLLVVAAVEKIDACPMEGFDPKKYSEILNLEEQNMFPVLVCLSVLGAEDDYMKDLAKVRKKTEEVIVEIK